MEFHFPRRHFVISRVSGGVRLEWYAPRGRGWTLYFWRPRHWTPAWPSRTPGGGLNVDFGPVELFWR